MVNVRSERSTQSTWRLTIREERFTEAENDSFVMSAGADMCLLQIYVKMYNMKEVLAEQTGEELTDAFVPDHE